jgi:hypothetical protein
MELAQPGKVSTPVRMHLLWPGVGDSRASSDTLLRGGRCVVLHLNGVGTLEVDVECKHELV